MAQISIWCEREMEDILRHHAPHTLNIEYDMSLLLFSGQKIFNAALDIVRDAKVCPRSVAFLVTCEQTMKKEDFLEDSTLLKMTSREEMLYKLDRLETFLRRDLVLITQKQIDEYKRLLAVIDIARFVGTLNIHAAYCHYTYLAQEYYGDSGEGSKFWTKVRLLRSGIVEHIKKRKLSESQKDSGGF